MRYIGTWRPTCRALPGPARALEYFGVPGADRRAGRYAAVKQEHVIKLIEMGEFAAFADALRFILAVKDLGIPVAAVSLSKNTELFLRQIRLDTFAAEQRLDYPFIRPGLTLFQLFDADVSGRDFPRGKHDPTMFLAAADELGATPGRCFVVEDAVTGVEAAKAGQMTALGVARLGDEELLLKAGADLVVTTLDDVSLEALAEGRLEQRRASAERQRRQRERPPTVWSLVYDGFDPEHQGLREALCALGNGYFVTRGALPEARADEVNYPGTYVAGLYNRLQTPIAGRTVENEDLVNVPNWLPLSFRLAGRAMVRHPGCRCPRSPPGTRPPAGDAHPAAALEGPGWPPHQHGAAPVRQHEGPAPGRPGDHLHGRELVGDAGSLVRPGRADRQLRSETLPRPERASSRGAARCRGGRGDRRTAGGDQPVPYPDSGRGPGQGPRRRHARRGRPAAGGRAGLRRARPHAQPGGAAPGDG